MAVFRLSGDPIVARLGAEDAIASAAALLCVIGLGDRARRALAARQRARLRASSASAPPTSCRCCLQRGRAGAGHAAQSSASAAVATMGYSGFLVVPADPRLRRPTPSACRRIASALVALMRRHGAARLSAGDQPALTPRQMKRAAPRAALFRLMPDAPRTTRRRRASSSTGSAAPRRRSRPRASAPRGSARRDASRPGGRGRWCRRCPPGSGGRR